MSQTSPPAAGQSPQNAAHRPANLWQWLVWAWDHSIGWVLMWALLIPIRAYQLAISPLLGPTCRFHPSCSNYAVGAIRTHGAIKGLALTGWRLGRCNPWNDGGLDPVPSRGKWRPDILPDGRPRASQQRTDVAAGE